MTSSSPRTASSIGRTGRASSPYRTSWPFGRLNTSAGNQMRFPPKSRTTVPCDPTRSEFGNCQISVHEAVIASHQWLNQTDAPASSSQAERLWGRLFIRKQIQDTRCRISAVAAVMHTSLPSMHRHGRPAASQRAIPIGQARSSKADRPGMCLTRIVRQIRDQVYHCVIVPSETGAPLADRVWPHIDRGPGCWR